MSCPLQGPQGPKGAKGSTVGILTIEIHRVCSTWVAGFNHVLFQGPAGAKGDTGLIGPPGLPVSIYASAFRAVFLLYKSFFLSFSCVRRVHQGRLSNPCLCSPPRRPNGPATCSRTQPPWTTARAWKTSLARSTIWNWTLSAWNTRWAHKTTRPEHAKICSSATQSSLMVSWLNSGARRTFIYFSADFPGPRLIRTYITCCRRAVFVDKHLCFRPADNILKNKERMLPAPQQLLGFFVKTRTAVFLNVLGCLQVNTILIQTKAAPGIPSKCTVTSQPEARPASTPIRS